MYTQQANRYTQFITPLGGIIALTCFFLPWLTRVDTGLNFSSTQLGFQLFVLNPPRSFVVFNIVVFMASVVIVGVSLYMVIRRTPWKSSVPVLISSGIGLAILYAEQLRYTRMTQILEFSNYSMELGFWGAAAGLIIAAFGILLVRTEKEKEHFKDSVEVKQLWFIVHAGGIVALFCFFMPWKGMVPVPLMGMSGFKLMNREFVVTIAFIASIIILVGSFYTLASGKLRRLREVVFVSIGIGLGILLSYCVDFYVGFKATIHSVKFGLWGTIFGFVIAAVGMFLIKRKNTNQETAVLAERE